jgi:hypothetical protein
LDFVLAALALSAALTLSARRMLSILAVLSTDAAGAGASAGVVVSAGVLSAFEQAATATTAAMRAKRVMQFSCVELGTITNVAQHCTRSRSRVGGLGGV